MKPTLNRMLAPYVSPRDCIIATFRSCEIGIARVPQGDLITMPFDAFILSGPKDRYLFRSTVSGAMARGYEVDPRMGVRELAVVRGEGAKPSVVMIEGDGVPLHFTFSALIAAAQERFSSVAFTGPFGAEPDAVPAMVMGIHSFLVGSEHPPQRILIPVTERSSLKEVDQFIDALNKEFGGWTRLKNIDVEKYLDDRSKAATAMPKHIVPSVTFFDQPIFSQYDETGDAYSVADLKKPSAGYVRLISNEVLDRALSHVPRFVRQARDGLPPPYVYARNSRIAERPELIARSMLAGHRTVSYNYGGEGTIYVLGEIMLTDLMRTDVDHTDNLVSSIAGAFLPAATAKILRMYDDSSSLPDDVFEMVTKGAPLPQIQPTDFDDFARIMVFQVLHECAEIMWYALPTSFQQRWMELYPLGHERKGDPVYYRNLIRIYNGEREQADERQFFGTETFADKLALFWNKDIPQLFSQVGYALTAEEKAYFKSVMKFAKAQREKHGTAFVLTSD